MNRNALIIYSLLTSGIIMILLIFLYVVWNKDNVVVKEEIPKAAVEAENSKVEKGKKESAEDSGVDNTDTEENNTPKEVVTTKADKDNAITVITENGTEYDMSVYKAADDGANISMMLPLDTPMEFYISEKKPVFKNTRERDNYVAKDPFLVNKTKNDTSYVRGGIYNFAIEKVDARAYGSDPERIKSESVAEYEAMNEGYGWDGVTSTVLYYYDYPLFSRLFYLLRIDIDEYSFYEGAFESNGEYYKFSIRTPLLTPLYDANLDRYWAILNTIEPADQ